MGYGFEGHIGLKKETTWGSGVAVTSGQYLEALSENVTLTIDRFTHKNIFGSRAEPDDIQGVNRIGGSISFPAHPISVGHAINGVLTQSSVTTVLSGFLHTNIFRTQSGDFSTDCPVQPYTLEIYRGVTSSQQYAGTCFTSLALKYTPNQAVMCDANVVARNTINIAKTTPTFPGSPAKPFTFDTVSLSIGGAGTVLIESLSVNITNNLEGIPVLNQSYDIGKVRMTDFQKISLSGTLDFTNITEYQNFVNQTEQQFIVYCTKANSFAMKVDIPRVVYTAFPLGIPGKERIVVSFEGKGYYHTGSGTAIEIQLTNTKSGY